VSPNNAQTVAAGQAATFNVKAKKSGTFAATFNSSCGEVVVQVKVN
jgi:hypothetical protein